MQWQTKSTELREWSNRMIIVSIVKNETEVGITIVHRPSFTGDTEMENRLNPIKEESLEVGSTTEKLNGSNGLIV